MLDRRIKVRHLQTFVEIARTGSLKRAGETLALTQPAVSKTLKELEEILGARLFHRSRAGVRPTPQGEVLRRFAETGLAALAQGVGEVGEMARQGGRRRFAVGALPSVAARLLPHLFEAYAEISPRTVLELIDGPHDYLIDLLRRGTLDLVIGRMGGTDSMTGLSFTQLYDERVAFIVRPGHPLAGETDPRRIADWPVIYPPKGAAIRGLVDRFCLAHGIAELPRRIETVSGAFGRAETQRADAVWVISEGVVAAEVAAGMLTRLPFATEMTLGPVGLTVREGSGTGPEWQMLRAALDRALPRAGIVPHPG
ncbi:pca operon transcription factor PcaQ [Roseivivax sp. CAU 1761]